MWARIFRNVGKFRKRNENARSSICSDTYKLACQEKIRECIPMDIRRPSFGLGSSLGSVLRRDGKKLVNQVLKLTFLREMNA